jgi:hypothetical protein
MMNATAFGSTNAPPARRIVRQWVLITRVTGAVSARVVPVCREARGGDFYLTTSGDFYLAIDTRSHLTCGNAELDDAKRPADTPKVLMASTPRSHLPG